MTLSLVGYLYWWELAKLWLLAQVLANCGEVKGSWFDNSFQIFQMIVGSYVLV